MHIVSAVILVLLSFPAFTQERVPANEKELKRQRQRAQAISMVEQAASEASLWDDKKAAVETLAAAADLLWDQSPGRAAKWIVKGWELIDQVPENQQSEWLKQFSTRSLRSDLRGIVLRVAHAHDPKLADRFISQLDKQDPNEKKDRGAFDDRTPRSEQFLRLAQQAVETNPELAFTLAQRSLVDGLSFSLQNLLTSLRKKNAELANRLFDLAMTRLSRNAYDPSEAEVLAGYLFQPGIAFSTNADGLVIMSMNPMLKNDPAPAQQEPRRAREFLVLVSQAFFTQPVLPDSPEKTQRAQKILMFGNRIAPRYDTFAPEFAVPARAFLTQLQAQIFPGGRADPFASSRQSSASTKARTESEALEARIATLEQIADETLDAKAKDLAYVNAALACNASDYERAQRIVEKISDEPFRDDAISYVKYRAALSLVKETDKATELATQIGHPPRRAVVRMAIAQNLLASKNDEEELKVNQQRAVDLLNTIEQDLRKQDPSPNVGRILLGRAALLGKLDLDQALNALAQALQAVNKLERFELQEAAAPRLGLNGSPRSEALLDSPRLGFSFRSAIEPLIPNEFDNLVNLADVLKAKELRGVARLEVGRLYLQKVK